MSYYSSYVLPARQAVDEAELCETVKRGERALVAAQEAIVAEQAREDAAGVPRFPISMRMLEVTALAWRIERALRVVRADLGAEQRRKKNAVALVAEAAEKAARRAERDRRQAEFEREKERRRETYRERHPHPHDPRRVQAVEASAREILSDLSRWPGYSSWTGMVARCADLSDVDYGGRGVRVCDEWCGSGGFLRFFVDMGPRPDGWSIDRIDPESVDESGGYRKSNCRWASDEVQALNKRKRSPETEARLIEALKVPPPPTTWTRQMPNPSTIERYLDARFAPSAAAAINATLVWVRQRDWAPCVSPEDFVALVRERCAPRDVLAVVEKRAREIYARCAEERARGHRRFHESLV